MSWKGVGELAAGIAAGYALICGILLLLAIWQGRRSRKRAEREAAARRTRPKIDIELRGGGHLDGTRLQMDSPIGHVIHVQVMPRHTRIYEGTGSGRTPEFEMLTFVYVGVRHELLLSQEERDIVTAHAGPLNLTSEALHRILDTHRILLVYQLESELPKPAPQPPKS